MDIDYVLLDVSNLCWRNWYRYRGIALVPSSNFKPIYHGLLQDLYQLHMELGCPRFLFCFDSEVSQRRVDYPDYKCRVKTVTQEEDNARVKRDIDTLRTKILPEIGYKNLYRESGFEADDIIGSLCKSREPGNNYCIISTDKDFYQLLAPHVSIWNPVLQQQLTLTWYATKYDLAPSQWIDYKALAGDISDSIPGVRGMGPVNTMRYLHGTLPQKGKAWENILKSTELIEKNKDLIRLPYYNLPVIRFPVQKDDVSKGSWNATVGKYKCPNLVYKWPLL